MADKDLLQEANDEFQAKLAAQKAADEEANKEFQKNNYYKMVFSSSLSTLGLAGGIWYAYSKKKKFWGYVGFGILFSFVGGAVGYFAGSAVDGKPK